MTTADSSYGTATTISTDGRQSFLIVPVAIRSGCHAFQQFSVELCARLRQRVEGPIAIFPRCDQADVSKVGQVPRGGGLRHVKDGDEIAHTQFAFLKQAHDAEADRIRDSSKEDRRTRNHIRRFGYDSRP